MIITSLHLSRLIYLITLFFLIFTADMGRAIAFDKINKTFFGVAIKGYDTVAYHTEGRAVKGDRKFSYGWNDAKWHFASVINRDLFAADPDRYAPEFGGY